MIQVPDQGRPALNNIDNEVTWFGLLVTRRQPRSPLSGSVRGCPSSVAVYVYLLSLIPHLTFIFHLK